MILEFTSDQFANIGGGLYQSPEFRQDSDDILVTIVVNLAEAGSFSMLESIDGVVWSPVENSTVVCDLVGLQTFTDCHYDLMYKISANKPVLKAQIAI
jgi:hypothetical protein